MLNKNAHCNPVTYIGRGKRAMVEKRRICPFTPAQAEPSPSQSLPDRRPKKKVTLNLSVESMDDVRNLVVRLNHYNVSSFVDEAIREHVRSVTQDWNGGRPFLTRDREVKRGRPKIRSGV